MDTPNGDLFRANAALSTLSHMFCYYNESGEGTEPADFGFGLSVILNHIASDISNACNYVENEREDTDEKLHTGRDR